MADNVNKVIENKLELLKLSPKDNADFLIVLVRLVAPNKEYKFNLGLGYTTNCPEKAAKTLLEREYSDTHLYDVTKEAAVFIPPIFVSHEHTNDFGNLKFNSKEEILKELKTMIDNIDKGDNKDEWYFPYLLREFTIDEFDDWRNKMKLLCVLRMGEEKNIITPGYLNTNTLESLWGTSYPLSTVRDKNKIKEKINGKYKRITAQEEAPRNYYFRRLLLNPMRAVGDEAERWLYEELQLHRGDLLKDAVVLHTLEINPSRINTSERRKQQEHDFVLFFPNRKLIIGIEVKRSLTRESADSALFQLAKLRNLIRNQCDEQFKNWNFYPVIFTMDNILAVNSDQIITKKTDFIAWLDKTLQQFRIVELSGYTQKLYNMFKTFIGYNDNSGRNESWCQLIRVLERLVFLMHISKGRGRGLIRTSNWTGYITESIHNVSTKDSILFYTNEQLPIFESSDDYNKLVLLGGYGTGKTILMMEKIEQILEEEEEANRIWFVLPEDKCLLLKLSLERKWKDKNEIEIKVCPIL